jgi:hypothetical protein
VQEKQTFYNYFFRALITGFVKENCKAATGIKTRSAFILKNVI